MTTSPTREGVVYVWLPDQLDPTAAGVLTAHEETGSAWAEFIYAPSYLARSDALPLDPVDLPLTAGPKRTRHDFRLFQGLRDAAPDSWGRHILCRTYGRVRMSEFDYLTLADPLNRIGALGFATSVAEAPGSFMPEAIRLAPRSAHSSLEAMIAAIDAVEADGELPLGMRPYLMRGCAVGGARPKMTADWRGGKWIAKFRRHDDLADVPRIEFAVMSLARQLGLDVPALELQEEGGQTAFLIERFDRTRLGASWTRRHVISGLTALGAHEADRDRWSYADLADFLRQKGADFAADGPQLFRRMIYNILVANEDDHLRNFSFLWDPKARAWRLSPLYDVVPSLRQTKKTPMSVLGMGTHGRIMTLDNALTIAPHFGLAAALAKKLAGAMQEEFTALWPHACRDACLATREIDLLRNVWRL